MKGIIFILFFIIIIINNIISHTCNYYTSSNCTGSSQPVTIPACVPASLSPISVPNCKTNSSDYLNIQCTSTGISLSVYVDSSKCNTTSVCNQTLVLQGCYTIPNHGSVECNCVAPPPSTTTSFANINIFSTLFIVINIFMFIFY